MEQDSHFTQKDRELLNQIPLIAYQVQQALDEIRSWKENYATKTDVTNAVNTVRSEVNGVNSDIIEDRKELVEHKGKIEALQFWSKMTIGSVGIIGMIVLPLLSYIYFSEKEALSTKINTNQSEIERLKDLIYNK